MESIKKILLLEQERRELREELRELSVRSIERENIKAKLVEIDEDIQYIKYMEGE